MAFNSVEHIMKDVNNGWLIRYIHANGASFFFIFVYLHIGRGLYYGSYRSPRTLLWSIGVVIFIQMMAKVNWPNWQIKNQGNIMEQIENYYIYAQIAFIKPNQRAIKRIGPHNKEVLNQIIWGLLGDWWCDRIPSKKKYSFRFQIDQEYKHKEYMLWLTKWFYLRGYCASIKPKTITRGTRKTLRLTLFTFTNLDWIYNAFYKNKPIKGATSSLLCKGVSDVTYKKIKTMPRLIEEFQTPASQAALIMQDGSRQKGQGISIATNCFTYEECVFLATLLASTYNLKTSVVSAGVQNQWKVTIWKESMPKINKLLKEHIIGNMERKINQ